MKLLSLFIILFPIQLLASLFEIKDLPPEVNVAEIYKVKISASGFNNTKYQRLKDFKNTTIDETIFLKEIDPWVQDQGPLYTDAEIIFTKKPDKKLTVELDGEKINIIFEDTKFNELNPPSEYISFPMKEQIAQRGIYLILFAIIILTVGSIAFYLHLNKNKKFVKIQKRNWVTKINNISTLSEISDLWLQKRNWLIYFPEMKLDLEQFEKKLNKVQFKDQIHEDEAKQIIKEFKNFQEAIKLRRKNGI